MAAAARSNPILDFCNACQDFHAPDKCPLAGGSSTPFVAVINDADDMISDGVSYEPMPVPDWKRKYDGNTNWTKR